MDGAKVLPDCGWLNLSVADSRCSATAWIRGLNTGLKSSKAHCHNNARPKLSCIPGHGGTISDGFRSTQKDQKVILACFKHMLHPYVEGTQPPLLAMKPRFHHAMPAVGDAVVVQGLPACQGFNGRRSPPISTLGFIDVTFGVFI